MKAGPSLALPLSSLHTPFHKVSVGCLLNFLPRLSTDHRFGWISGKRHGACLDRETVLRKFQCFHPSLSRLVFAPRNLYSFEKLVSLDTVHTCISYQRVEERGLLIHRGAEFSVFCREEIDKVGWCEHEITMGSLPHRLVWFAVHLNDQGNELVGPDEGLLPKAWGCNQ